MVQSQLTSTLFRFYVVLWRIFVQIGSISLPPRGPWKQWEATSLCGSQPPMRSPSLFPHCHFRVSTHSFNIPLSPPLYTSTSSHYSSHFSSLFLMRETAYKVQRISADSVWSPDTNTVSDCVSTNHWYKPPAFMSNVFYFKQPTFASQLWYWHGFVWSLFHRPLWSEWCC